jgi:hypothetical protein
MLERRAVARAALFVRSRSSSERTRYEPGVDQADIGRMPVKRCPDAKTLR